MSVGKDKRQFSIIVQEDDEVVVKFWVIPSTNGGWNTSKKRVNESGAKELVFNFKRPSVKDVNGIRRDSTSYDETISVFRVDPDKVDELRWRRWLRSWNLHEVFEGTFQKVQTQNNMLLDSTMKEIWKLDPVVFKSTLNLLSEQID